MQNARTWTASRGASWFVLAMVAACGAVLYLVVIGVDVLLLAFAGLLFALFLRGLAAATSRATGLRTPTALGVVVALLVGLLALGGWLIAPAVVEQTGQLLQQLPEAVTELRERMEASAWGRALLPYVPSTDQVLSVERPLRAGSTVLATLGWAAGGAASVVLVVFIGLYVAAAPRPYRHGLLYLVPERRRRRTERVLDTLGHTLQRWLVGKVAGVLLIGALTGVGLGVLQVPLALALGVLAGLLNFIPYIGPLMSFVPAALLATMQGAGTLLWVLGLYLVIQGLESYVVTPLIQQQAVALPPALLITAQVLLGVAGAHSAHDALARDRAAECRDSPGHLDPDVRAEARILAQADDDPVFERPITRRSPRPRWSLRRLPGRSGLPAARPQRPRTRPP